MAAYADYAFYQNEYGGKKVSETEFKPLSLKASALVDQITFHRAEETNEVKMAVCAAVDSLSIPGDDGNIASENNDGYSVTYKAKTEQEIRTAAVNAIRDFLPKELTNRGCWP